MNCSDVGPSHGQQFFINCSSVCPSHEVQSFRNRLLQHGSLQGHKSCQQTCSSMCSSVSMGPQVLPGACSRVGLPTGSEPPLGISTCSSVGPSTACRWLSAQLWTVVGCRGTACLTLVFTTGCRGISALVPGAMPPPLSSLTLLSPELFVSHVVTPSFSCRLFLFFLKYVNTEMLPPLLISLALVSGGFVLEPAGVGLIRLRGIV